MNWMKGLSFLLISELILLVIWFIITGAFASPPAPLNLFKAIADDLGITVYDLATGIWIFGTVICVPISFLITAVSD